MKEATDLPLSHVLVTGANGFLGAEVVRQLRTSRLRVRATYRTKIQPTDGVEYQSVDILDTERVAAAMVGMDSVIHTAGLAHLFNPSPVDTARFDQINVTGTANMVSAAAAAGVKHFVLVSSVAVYGGSTDSGDESAPCRPQTPYAKSKWLGEQQAIEIATSSPMILTILRMATLYGEEDPGNVARLMREIDQKRFIWIGNGANRKSLIYRSDAAEATIQALEKPIQKINIYNVSAPPTTMSEVIHGLATHLGRTLPSWQIPTWLALSAVKGLSLAFQEQGSIGKLCTTIKKWVADDVYNGTKFAQTYDFQNKVQLFEGLRREVAWYKTVT